MKNDLLIPSVIAAVNDRDTKGFLSNFADTAILTDEGQEYHGTAAIKEWSDERLIGANVTFNTIDVTNTPDGAVVTAEVDGGFDKTGLPDPFVMALTFVVSGSKIERLTFGLPEEL